MYTITLLISLVKARKMTEYTWEVEKQRQMLMAEEWAKTPKSVHIHSIDCCWYDTRPQDTAGGKKVIDIHYNNGVITREQKGKMIATFGEKLEGDELRRAWLRGQQR